MLIDTHAHLHVKDFDHDRDAVIKRAYDAGVKLIFNVGFDPEGNEDCAALAGKHDFIFWTAGIHPHHADLATKNNLEKIEELSASSSGKKLVALGEIGLDYYKNRQHKEIQLQAFHAQLKLAKKLNLPVIIHCRDAFADLFTILAEEKIDRALLHCFTGTLEEAKEAWERGFYTAFTGIITYPSAVKLREVVKACPIEKLIIETDCPFLAPQKYRGERNEPAYVVEIAKAICELKKIAMPEFEEILSQNVTTLFPKCKRLFC